MDWNMAIGQASEATIYRQTIDLFPKTPLVFLTKDEIEAVCCAIREKLTPSTWVEAQRLPEGGVHVVLEMREHLKDEWSYAELRAIIVDALNTHAQR